MGLEQAGDRRGRDQRHVAGEDEHGLALLDQLPARRGSRRRCRRPRAARPSRRPRAGRRRGRVPGETIAATRPAPASRAARIGQATIARPQTGCSIFGVEERIRVPSPGRHDEDQGGAHLPDRIGAKRAASLGSSFVGVSGARESILADESDRGQRPAGEDQVDADQQADRPVGASWGTWRGRGSRSAGRRRR